MTRNAQDIIDDMRNIVKPRIAEMLLKAKFEGCGKEDKAEFETEFEMILTLAEKALEQEPCDDCVSRAYIESIVEELENICANGDEHILDLLANIKNAPPVTPQPKIGHWIEEINDYEEITHWHCSNCYGDSGFITTCKWDYCPNCGAKMQEVEE